MLNRDPRVLAQSSFSIVLPVNLLKTYLNGPDFIAMREDHLIRRDR
jgi:hypothetical protein